MNTWVTNDAEAAARLREIDEQYARDRAAGAGLALHDKIEHYSDARERRNAAYAALLINDT
jgi:hypothetical protein